MTNDANPLSSFLSEQPHAVNARKRAARSIAAMGAHDVEKRMRQLRERAQHVASHAGYDAAAPMDDTSGVHRAAPKSRKLRHSDRMTPYATIAISYSLRNRALYFYGHDVTFYVDAYARGVITRSEIDAIARNVELMGGGD